MEELDALVKDVFNDPHLGEPVRLVADSAVSRKIMYTKPVPYTQNHLALMSPRSLKLEGTRHDAILDRIEFDLKRMGKSSSKGPERMAKAKLSSKSLALKKSLKKKLQPLPTGLEEHDHLRGRPIESLYRLTFRTYALTQSARELAIEDSKRENIDRVSAEKDIESGEKKAKASSELDDMDQQAIKQPEREPRSKSTKAKPRGRSVSKDISGPTVIEKSDTKAIEKSSKFKGKRKGNRKQPKELSSLKIADATISKKRTGSSSSVPLRLQLKDVNKRTVVEESVSTRKARGKKKAAEAAVVSDGTATRKNTRKKSHSRHDRYSKDVGGDSDIAPTKKLQDSPDSLYSEEVLDGEDAEGNPIKPHKVSSSGVRVESSLEEDIQPREISRNRLNKKTVQRQSSPSPERREDHRSTARSSKQDAPQGKRGPRGKRSQKRSTSPSKAQKPRRYGDKKQAASASAIKQNVPDNLTVLGGTGPKKAHKFNYTKKQLAERENLTRVEQERPVAQTPMDIDVQVHTPTLLNHILQFKNGTSSQKQILQDKPFFDDELFTLAIVPGCLDFQKVDLTLYMRRITSTHVNHLDLESEKDPDAFDDISVPMEERKWERLCKKLILKRYDVPVIVEDQVCPPFIPSTKDTLSFLANVLTKFFKSDEKSCENLFQDLYSQPRSDTASLIELMGRLSLLVIAAWGNILRTHTEILKRRSHLFEAAVKLLAKVFMHELHKHPTLKESNGRVLWLCFTKKDPISLREMFNVCVSYFSYDVERKRESGPLVEMLQSYVTSVFCPHDMEEYMKELWNEAKDPRILDDLCLSDHWNLFVQAPFQTVLRSEPKVYNSHGVIAFLVSLLRHPMTCREAFTRQLKTRDVILDIAVRALNELAREPLSCFVDLWEFTKSVEQSVTCVDLWKQLLTYGFVLKELFSSSDVRRNEIFDGIQGLLSKSALLRLRTVGRDSVDKWWRSGPFSKKIDEIVDPSEPVRVVSKNEERARYYGFASIARIIGSLGVSFDDLSRDLQKPNPLNTFLQQKANSARNALQILEQLLTILEHLHKSVEAPERGCEGLRLSKKGSAEQAPRCDGKVQIVHLLFDDDRDHFAHAIEAVRIHVCELKNVPKLCNALGSNCAADKPGTLSMKQAPVKPAASNLPDVNSLPRVQVAVASQKGYINLEDDVSFMKTIANFASRDGHDKLARFDKADTATRWVRLRRNAYVDDARDFLTKEDKEVGQMCTCLAARSDGRSESTTKIGCSNEMCENRMMKVECGPGPCGSGEHCKNRRLQNLEYAKTIRSVMKGKGVGLVAAELIPEGSLIGEYQGEIISMNEYEQRKKEYAGERHFYFMTLTNKLVIDASRKSQITRFVNHSCNPNCVAEKWNAGAHPRVAIIAIRPIKKDEEITFNYGARAIGTDSAPCLCGASNCRGQLTSAEVSSKDADGKSTAKVENGSKPKSASNVEPVKDVMQMAKPQETVPQKIEHAKKRIQASKELLSSLKNRKDEVTKYLNDEKEFELSKIQSRKVEEWKRSLPSVKEHTAKNQTESLKPKKVEDGNIDSDPTRQHAFDIPIPRINPAELLENEERKKAAALSSTYNRMPRQKDSRFQPANQVGQRGHPQARQYPETNRSGGHQHVNPNPTFRHGIAPGCAPSLIPRGSQNQRQHVGPLEEAPGGSAQPRRNVFQPTRMKAEQERVKRRPPIAKKAADRSILEHDSDVSDSWSVVSDAEPPGPDYEVPPAHFGGRKNLDMFEKMHPGCFNLEEEGSSSNAVTDQHGEQHQKELQKTYASRFSFPVQPTTRDSLNQPPITTQKVQGLDGQEEKVDDGIDKNNPYYKLLKRSSVTNTKKPDGCPGGIPTEQRQGTSAIPKQAGAIGEPLGRPGFQYAPTPRETRGQANETKGASALKSNVAKTHLSGSVPVIDPNSTSKALYPRRGEPFHPQGTKHSVSRSNAYPRHGFNGVPHAHDVNVGRRDGLGTVETQFKPPTESKSFGQDGSKEVHSQKPLLLRSVPYKPKGITQSQPDLATKDSMSQGGAAYSRDADRSEKRDVPVSQQNSLPLFNSGKDSKVETCSVITSKESQGTTHGGASEHNMIAGDKNASKPVLSKKQADKGQGGKLTKGEGGFKLFLRSQPAKSTARHDSEENDVKEKVGKLIVKESVAKPFVEESVGKPFAPPHRPSHVRFQDSRQTEESVASKIPDGPKPKQPSISASTDIVEGPPSLPRPARSESENRESDHGRAVLPGPKQETADAALTIKAVSVVEKANAAPKAEPIQGPDDATSRQGGIAKPGRLERTAVGMTSGASEVAEPNERPGVRLAAMQRLYPKPDEIGVDNAKHGGGTFGRVQVTDGTHQGKLGAVGGSLDGSHDAQRGQRRDFHERISGRSHEVSQHLRERYHARDYHHRREHMGDLQRPNRDVREFRGRDREGLQPHDDPRRPASRSSVHRGIRRSLDGADIVPMKRSHDVAIGGPIPREREELRRGHHVDERRRSTEAYRPDRLDRYDRRRSLGAERNPREGLHARRYSDQGERREGSIRGVYPQGVSSTAGPPRALPSTQMRPRVGGPPPALGESAGVEAPRATYHLPSAASPLPSHHHHPPSQNYPRDQYPGPPRNTIPHLHAHTPIPRGGRSHPLGYGHAGGRGNRHGPQGYRSSTGRQDVYRGGSNVGEPPRGALPNKRRRFPE